MKARFTTWLVGSSVTSLSPELLSFRFPVFECRARNIAAAVGGGIVTGPGVFPRTPRPSQVPPTSIAACADVLPRVRRVQL